MNEHAQPIVETPTLQHALNLDLVLQYVYFLLQRGCSKATIAEQVDVAWKIVFWLMTDQQLPAGTSQQAAQDHLELLQRLQDQVKANLQNKPRRPLPQLVTPEHLTVLVLEAREEATQIVAKGCLSDLKISSAERTEQAERVLLVCLACLFWAHMPPLRASGVSLEHRDTSTVIKQHVSVLYHSPVTRAACYTTYVCCMLYMLLTFVCCMLYMLLPYLCCLLYNMHMLL